MFVREIVNIKVGSSDGAKQYTKILGMLRRLTYISGFFGKALYVVPSVRLKATCVRPGYHSPLSRNCTQCFGVRQNAYFCAGQSAFDRTVQTLKCVGVPTGSEASCTWGAQYR
jgi:hypothetical protein